jgi:LmbE family N-acetylglucosaminyl deacetylase
MPFNNKKILVIAPHIDDETVNCGGTIARLTEKEKRNDLLIIALSDAQVSLPEGLDKGILRKELPLALKELGATKEEALRYYEVYDFPVREFSAWRQVILDAFCQLNKDFQPDVIITTNSCDTHQDHKVVAEESWRAFKYAPVFLGYECYRNDVHFQPTFYVTLEQDHVFKKLKAMEKYKSQMKRNGTPEEIVDLMRMRGAQVKKKYAEAFEVRRWIA